MSVFLNIVTIFFFSDLSFGNHKEEMNELRRKVDGLQATLDVILEGLRVTPCQQAVLPPLAAAPAPAPAPTPAHVPAHVPHRFLPSSTDDNVIIGDHSYSFSMIRRDYMDIINWPSMVGQTMMLKLLDIAFPKCTVGPRRVQNTVVEKKKTLKMSTNIRL